MKAIHAEVRAANREGREVKLTDAQMTQLGHGPQPLSKVIRQHCLNCMGGNRAEVRRCTSVACNLYPYRMNRNPYHGSATRCAVPSDNRHVQDDTPNATPKTS